MADEEKKLGTILLVDDDEYFLKIQTNFLSKHYNLVTAISGTKGLELLQKGLKPQIIISDQFMPEMTGDEFLAQSLHISPDSVRIVVTSSDDSHEIIKCINNAHAYMFVRKPVDQLSIIQIIKNALSYYNAKISRIREINKLRSQLELVEKHKTAQAAPMTDNEKLHLLRTFSYFSENYNRNYFVKYNTALIQLTLGAAEEMNMTDTEIEKMTGACFLIPTVLNNLNETIILSDIHVDLDNSQTAIFKDNFKMSAGLLYQNRVFSNYISLILQLFEHHDGSGKPNGITGDAFYRTSQLIAISAYYLDLVFKIDYEQYLSLKNGEKVVLPVSQIMQRYTKALDQLKMKAKWYSFDVYAAFSNYVKRKKLDITNPTKCDYVLDWSKNKFHSVDEPNSADKEVDETEPLDLTEVPDIEGMSVVEISPSKVEIGMLVAQSFKTKSGIAVINEGDVIDKKVLRNIQQLNSTGMFESNIAVYQKES